MSNTFTAQELADFYQKVADGGEIDYTLMPKDCFGHPENGPHMGCSKDVWRIKPTKKVIDLSVLIDSQIDCEFKDDNEAGIFISKLSRQGDPSMNYRYYDGDGDTWESCQPRMNHIHAWQGGECPLPEGFRVQVWWRGGLFEVRQGDLFQWGIQKNSSRDIIAFEVLGLADGYVMPWEQDND
tara:strand:- start:166 stop:711 length:546 start_codon:yes stop_codon:yes gene_type:complete